MSSGQVKWKKEVFGPVPFLLTFPKNLTTRFVPLKKSPRKSTGQNREPADQESVLWAGEVEDGNFGQSSVPLHFPKNRMTNFELLKKSLKKVDRQTAVTPIQKESPGLAKTGGGELRPKFLRCGIRRCVEKMLPCELS